MNFWKNISEMIQKFNKRKTKNIKIKLFNLFNKWYAENHFEKF